MSEDDIDKWQDALEALMNQRPDMMPKCRFCKNGVISVTRDGRKTRLECQSCHHYLEGRFDDDNYNFT